MTSNRCPGSRRRFAILRAARRSAVVCSMLAAVPATARAQEPGQQVEVAVRAVSEGGAAIEGISVTVHDVTAVTRGPTLVGRFASEDNVITVVLAVGREDRRVGSRRAAAARSRGGVEGHHG